MLTVSERKPAGQEMPHLSVVAVSRNDDHGGDLQGRMQHFVNGFIAQCRKHRLNAELILVEWNPPVERAPLEDSLEWPADFGPVSVRVVTVSPELHASLPHASALALFQMIGKNVGIRRARGRYVLATNIDILLDDATVLYLRDRLQDGTLLRADRYDVPSDLPDDLPFDRVLSDCHSRWFQVHTRLGTLDARSRRMIGRDKGATTRLLGLYCETQIFGWREPAGRAGRRLGAQVQDRWNAARAWGTLLTSLPLAHGADAARRGLHRISGIMRREWAKVSPVATLPSRAYWQMRRLQRRLLPHLRLRLPHQMVLRRKVRSISRRINGILRLFPKAWNLPMVQMTPRTPPARRLARMQRLHTNGCGDFTLLSREDWFRLRGYPEWPIFSWHIDSVFLFAASANDIPQIALDSRHRIYHIDHSKGSGWSHDGAAALFTRLDSNGIPYISNELARRKQLEFAETPVAGIINGEDWGFAGHHLPERDVLPAATNRPCRSADKFLPFHSGREPASAELNR
jgi:hypothetical protein